MDCPCRVHVGHLRRPLLPSSLSRCLLPLPPRPSSVSFHSPSPLFPHFFATSSRSRLVPRASVTVPSPSGDEALKGALFFLLRPVSVVALAMGVALFFARMNRPSFAFALSFPANPAAVSDTIPFSSSATQDDYSGTLTDEVKERTLEEYLDSHPEDTRALRALMKLKIRARKPAEASAIVDRLIVLEPGEKGLPLLKAHLQSQGGDTETATKVLEEMLQKDPLFVEAYHGLVMAASQLESEGDLGGILKRIEDAMATCKKQKRKEELRDFKLLVAQVKVIQAEYGEALKVYQELVKEEPRDFRPYLCQGIIYTLLRKKDEAKKQFQKYRRLVPRGHPYAQYFDENMVAMDVFSLMGESNRTAALKR